MKSFYIVALLLAFPQMTSAETLMQVHTFPTDLAGNAIASISVGEQFKLQTYATDVRNPPETTPGGQGVFSAGADIFYDPALSAIDIAQSVQFGSFFNLIRESTLQQGQVIGYAATSSFTGPGNAPQFLFSVVLTATAAGTQTFLPTLDTTNPDHEYNMWLIDPPFPTNEIDFVSSSLQIVPEPSTYFPAAIGVIALLAFRRRKR